MIIREATHSDISNISELFMKSVLAIPLSIYSKEDKESWCLKSGDISHWTQVVDQQYFLVAYQKGRLMGFSSLDFDKKELDYLYVSEDCQRKKVATILLHEIEHYAKGQSIGELTAVSSLAANPFFLKNGFEVIEDTVKTSAGGRQLKVSKVYKVLEC